MVSVTSVSTSSASASATTSVIVVLMIGVALLVSSLVAEVLPTVAALVLVGAETHESRNNLFGLSVLLALSLLLLFLLGDPHFDLNRLDGSKQVLVVKSLDCLLSVRYGVVKNVRILGCDNSLTIGLDWLRQFKRNDVAWVAERELISQSLFTHVTGNEFNVNVWVEGLSQTLSPKINRTASLVQFTFSLADVVVDN